MRIEHSPELNRQKGAYFVCLLRDWDKYGESRRKEERRIEVADFDVSGNVNQYLIPEDNFDLKVNPVRTRNQALFRMVEILECFDPNTLDGEYIRWKIRSLATYAQAKEGRKFEFYDYIEGTLALEEVSPIVPSEIPQEMIDAQKAKVSNKFSLLGYDYNRVGWERFLLENSLTPDEAKRDFEASREEFIPIFKENLGVSFEPKYRFEFVDEDEYWVNWVDGDYFGYSLKFNTHERVKNRWYRGSPERLFTHEILTHLFQVDSWKRNIAAGLINPGYGITSVPGPEQPPCEGLADSLPYFIDELYEKLSPYAQFAVEQILIEDWVQRNFHIRVNTERDNHKKSSEYLLDQLPNVRPEDVDRKISDRLYDQRLRSYLLAYGYSYEHVQYAKRLSRVESPRRFLSLSRVEPIDKRIDLVKFSFKQPVTMLQLHRYVTELEKQKLDT